MNRRNAVTGAFNIAGVERNLRKKLPAALPVFGAAMKQVGIEVIPLPSKNDLVPLAGLTAEKDLPVITSAVSGKADVLVTGDKKDLLLRGAVNILHNPCCSPSTSRAILKSEDIYFLPGLVKLKRRPLPFALASPAEFLDELLPRLLKSSKPPGD